MSKRALPDEDARRQALDIHGSYIVQAPAGSGKTDLLVSRYLKLLAIVDEPEELLAITFTRKAAAEMRARILEALAGERREPRWQSLIDAALKRDTQRNWQLVSSPARLRVMTIDSLCQQLVRQMPWTAGFGAVPDVTEQSGTLFADAVRATLKYVDDPDSDYRDDLLKLLAYFDNNHNQVESLLEQMLVSRDQWADALLGDESVIDRELLESNLAAVIGHALQRASDAITQPLLQQIQQLSIVARDNLVAAQLPCEFEALALAPEVPSTDAQSLPIWHAVKAFVLTRTGTLRKTVNKNTGFPPGKTDAQKNAKRDMTAWLTTLAEDPSRSDAVEALAQLPPNNRYGESQWALLEALSRVLRLALAQLTLVFNDAATVDFTEMQLRAITALTADDAPTDLALRLDYRISHILVDEFQDTSASQCRLLELLTAGWSGERADRNTLFVVGDPMQSIYRFRQSEVALFMRYALEPLGQIALSPLTLTANFRSVESVIEWVNAAFASVLPSRADTVTGAVPFSASVAMKDDDSDGDAVFVHACRSDEDEASHVADIIDAHHARFPDHRIAVLVRARSHLDMIVRVLRERNIRYRGVALEPLATRPVVRDLFSLTRALVHPADHVAWMAILRAPWCGLSLPQLLSLSHLIRDGDDARSHQPVVIFQRLHVLLNDGLLSTGYPSQLTVLVQVVNEAIDARGRFRLSERVRRAWNALSGPACCSRESDLVDAQTFFGLLDDVDTGDDINDLESLVEITSTLRAAADSESTEKLQLMPVHQAKGLEFDCVILPGLGRRAAIDRQKLLLMGNIAAGTAGPMRLVAPPTPRQGDEDGIYSMIRRHESSCTRFEHARLLYVACTRAQSRMHLLGVPSITEKNGVTAPPGSSLELMWPALQGAFSEIDVEDALDDSADSKSDATPLQLVRLPEEYAIVEPFASLVLRPDDQADADSVQLTEQIEFSWAGEVARHVGTLVHQELALIAAQGLDYWDARRLKSRRALWQRTLTLLGVAGDDLKRAVSNVERALKNTLTSDTGRWTLMAHENAQSELPLTGWVENQVRSLIVDRTFVADGVRWILDFKTSFHGGADLDGFLLSEKERYREQLNAYAAVVSEMDKVTQAGEQAGAAPTPQSIRLGLYFPLHDRLVDWEH